jgi:type II secretion system protein C
LIKGTHLAQDFLFRVLGDKWLRLVVLLVVLALLAHQISLVVWHFVPVPDAVAIQHRDLIVRTQDASQPGTNYQQQSGTIGRAFLFGKAAAKVVQVIKVEEAPETELKYKLRGIYFSSEPKLSSAIVEVQPNKSKAYLIDDELADNITLAKIEKDHILINRYGKLERLHLQKPLPTPALNKKSTIVRSERGGTGNQSALLRSYKKRYNSNPMALATRFQAIPVQQDGRNIGFKLKALRGESLLKKLDFQANDVFTAVNGVGLDNPFEALDALKSLTTAPNISVTFMRNGSEQTMDFKL